MKRHIVQSTVFWALVMILAAAALILDGIGVDLGTGFSFWRIALGIVLTAWLVSEIVRLRFHHIFFPLAFLFILFEAPIATHLFGRSDPNLINDWIVILAAFLLTAGFTMLLKPKHEFGNLATKTLYVEAKDLTDYRISDNVGKIDLYVTGRAFYPGNGKITVCDNVGKVLLHLPKEWTVVLEKSDNLGSVEIPPQELDHEQSVTLSVCDNVGNIQVVFE